MQAGTQNDIIGLSFLVNPDSVGMNEKSLIRIFMRFICLLSQIVDIFIRNYNWK
jgi:hypothetical protein